MKQQDIRKFLKDKSLNRIIKNLDINLESQIFLLKHYKEISVKTREKTLVPLVLEELEYIDNIISVCDRYKLSAALFNAYEYCSHAEKRNVLLKNLKLTPQTIINPKKK